MSKGDCMRDDITSAFSKSFLFIFFPSSQSQLVHNQVHRAFADPNQCPKKISITFKTTLLTLTRSSVSIITIEINVMDNTFNDIREEVFSLLEISQPEIKRSRRLT